MTVTETDVETIALSVPARSEFLRIVRLVMAAIGSASALDVEQIDDIKTAVGEAFNTFCPSDGHPLSLRVAVTPRRLIIEMSQRLGGGLARFHSMDPSMEKGIGILLMKHLMDEVEYRTDADQTRVRLVKRYR